MTINPNLQLQSHRRTKIVATVGPRSRSSEMLRSLVEAGVDVFRLNMSHGNTDDHAQAIAHIRAHAQACGRQVGILADLCGPKIRTGRFVADVVHIETGTRVTVTTRDVPGTATVIPSRYAALPRDVVPGNRILLNDGAVELVVREVTGEDVMCDVVAGGVVGHHKGINLPGVAVSAPSLTDRDIEDARFALAQRVDFIALSFVRSAADVELLRALVGEGPQAPALIAKIEKPEALANSHEIIRAADGIMIARGDLGVELHPEQVPLAQNQLIHRARLYDRPVIVATQMLESMIENARPTRAEVTDVSHAVAAGADAVMLSGETAVGEHPLAAVGIMVRIAHQTEAYHLHDRLPFGQPRASTDHRTVPFGDAVANSVAKLAEEAGAAAIVVISMHGMTATTISAARPVAPIIAVTHHAETGRRMSLLWGTIPYVDPAVGEENPNHVARRAATSLGLGKTGDFVIVVRGFHSDPARNTPTITLLKI
ncbi:MAG: pyruvate kinase [Gammaproteobacteria bacterium]